jgi:ABC-type branched-subunit amino acid transport system permease subunit
MLYVLFQKTAAARLLVLAGHSRLLVAELDVSPMSTALLANTVCGLCAGGAGIAMALQTGLVAPSSFSLYRGLLYVSGVILVGYRHLGPLVVATALIALLPEVLRLVGLGDVDASAWRGVIVGAGVLLVVVLQAPHTISRAASKPVGA